ncbi:D-alanine--D-alanine ligase family protein [Spirochaeta isovalerica]|uniref:D-alanine--D-alanine ligase n=1 Tax=Spirochaeta isovalerica TaxID=150 RepID=A0A841R8P6_9SPIO|nr:D-alanine--D-alanine ligase family protein [Spirochaeta isovalerica]MBB6481664.1 D-alanine-D-alanine ligase [Spirochaeta isovalerica]
MKNELILLYGGRSGEHEVSLRSAASVYNHLDKQRYNVTLIALSKEGLWYVQDNPSEECETLPLAEETDRLVSLLPMQGLLCRGEIIKPYAVFPVIHGTFGEDGTLQGLMEMCGFPYAGATTGGSYLGMDKEMAKIIWKSHGIDIIPFRTVRKFEYNEKEREAVNGKLVDELGLPLFVKPAMAGSSLGVSRVEGKDQLEEAILFALQFDTKAIVERAVKGKEVECSVIGNHETSAFPPGEIAPTHAFYDYEAKYIDPDGALLIIPAELEEKTAESLKSIARKAYEVLDLRGFARVDFFVEEKGRIILNEVNTIPGFTSISMFSMMCDVGGLPYGELLDRLIELAREQFAERSSLKFSLN